MGVLIESPGCFPSLTVWDNMMLQAANLSIKDAEKEVIRVLKTVRMEGAAGNKYKNCSLGMKQRVGIAMALLGDPTLLILDEPLHGLDMHKKQLVSQAIERIAEQPGMSLIYVTHYSHEIPTCVNNVKRLVKQFNQPV